ncbi:MAG: FAD-dependent oxidoreductase [Nocardioidaceae bacterium]
MSSRDRVLPTEDADAAKVIEDVLTRRGMTLLGRSRAASVGRRGDSVVVTLDRRAGGRGLALPAGGRLGPQHDRPRAWTPLASTVDETGFIRVDRVSRTSARGVYAAGDCTGVLMLASVAAMQGSDRHVARAR